MVVGDSIALALYSVLKYYNIEQYFPKEPKNSRINGMIKQWIDGEVKVNMYDKIFENPINV